MDSLAKIRYALGQDWDRRIARTCIENNRLALAQILRYLRHAAPQLGSAAREYATWLGWPRRGPRPRFDHPDMQTWG